ncbi:MAG: hypothetical protein CO106_05890 [Deltaproteobacteria bacterium CG_4_9_14_3_um_filter_44_9]|nr:MAG: hypothetical protein CO106_05890 [Deltaproteobacteria bacterium CG_4_9_14_3_um_filter_44_9]
MISEQWSVNSGQWTVDSGQWTVDSEQWSVISGQFLSLEIKVETIFLNSRTLAVSNSLSLESM